jgi:hypothetical protein
MSSLRGTPGAAVHVRLRRFSGGMLFETLKMHPKVLINNCLIENL